MKRSLLILLLLAWAVPMPVYTQEEHGYQVIVNPANAVKSISREQLSAYLLKKKRRWPKAEAVKPADLTSRSPVRSFLSEEVHERSVAGIKNYWLRQIFSGRNVPPPEFASDADMIEFVASHPGALGYVAATTELGGSVKVLKIVD